MSDVPSQAESRGRDAEAARAAILEAAKRQRYFGGKEALFVEALKASFHPDRLRSWDRRTLPHAVAAMMADGAHANEEDTHGFQFLLRTATSPTTAPLLNVAVQERFLAPIREWLGGEDAQARARVLAAIYIGLLVERLIRDQPLAGREREAFIEQASAIIEAMIPPTP